MRNLSSQLIVTENAVVLRNSVVSLSEGKFPVYNTILENNHERSSTFFYDGIITPLIYSISQRGGLVSAEYDYLNLTDNFQLQPSTKKMIIDFGTEQVQQISQLLRNNITAFECYSVFDLIFGLSVYPLKCLPNFTESSTSRVLWQGVDLLNKKITNQITLSVI